MSLVLKGVMQAQVTPFNEDFSLDLPTPRSPARPLSLFQAA